MEENPQKKGQLKLNSHTHSMQKKKREETTSFLKREKKEVPMWLPSRRRKKLEEKGSQMPGKKSFNCR